MKTQQQLLPLKCLQVLRILFFKQFIKYENYFTIYNLDGIINHGVRTKSLMAVAFKEDMKQLSLKVCHYYTLIDMKEKFVEIYNPHGRTIREPKTIFFDYFFSKFLILRTRFSCGQKRKLCKSSRKAGLR